MKINEIKKQSLKVNDLSQVILKFFKEINNDEDGRYLSFEYLNKVFNEYCNSNGDDLLDKTALYFYAYLASWGMLRNSFLLYKSFTFNKEILRKLKECKLAKKPR